MWGTSALVVAAAVSQGPTPGRGTFLVTASAQTVQPSATCDSDGYARSEAEFNRLTALSRLYPDAVSAEALRAASTEYLLRGEACYRALYGDHPQKTIDDDGLWHTPNGAAPYGLAGRKWGLGSPYTGGANTAGPRLPGGTVTYSFTATGVAYSESDGGSGTLTAISSLPGFSACFLSDIRNALSAWSAVANIQFTEVADNGLPFNQSGATGDIRISAHSIDGDSGTLAHGYYPPPNGTSAAGDVHFDDGEVFWSCSPGGGGIDIGIVAAHEFGHAIGLDHSTSTTALMGPFYNPSIPGPLADDIAGAQNIYGNAAQAGNLLADFGPSYGEWMLIYGAGWAQLHDGSPEEVVTGDMDGNGVDEIILDFGPFYGVWVRVNNSSWVHLHNQSPVAMAVADMDSNGQKDVILSFATAGVWVRYNNAVWTQLHTQTATRIVAGQLDSIAGEDVILNIPGSGLWKRMNNATWVPLHSLNSTVIATGNMTGSAIDEIVVDFGPSSGLWSLVDGTTWNRLTPLTASKVAIGNIDGNPYEDLVADFGSSGIWAARNGPNWLQLHALPAEGFVIGDLDGNGRGEVSIDFGSSGLWIWVNDASWVQGHTVSPEGLAVADITP